MLNQIADSPIEGRYLILDSNLSVRRYTNKLTDGYDTK